MEYFWFSDNNASLSEKITDTLADGFSGTWELISGMSCSDFDLVQIDFYSGVLVCLEMQEVNRSVYKGGLSFSLIAFCLG